MNRNDKHSKPRRIVSQSFRLTSEEILADLMYPAPVRDPKRRTARR
ncbi:MAG TPA: hypothetical protein VFH44_05835 [Solirubrobacterales bacterium]|nr:hypothetical protein [Solirubrobacterales bacterium]